MFLKQWNIVSIVLSFVLFLILKRVATFQGWRIRLEKVRPLLTTAANQNAWPHN